MGNSISPKGSSLLTPCASWARLIQAAIKQKPEHISEKGVVSKTSTNQTSVVVPPKQAVKETKQEDIVVKKEQQSPAVSPSNLSVHINRAQLAQRLFLKCVLVFA
jgi:hypothetical protein